MKYDIRLLTKAADDLLGTVTNPVHRRILINYRRHAIFEVCGLSTAEQKSAIRRRKTRPSCYMPGGVA
ncbi:hypothetical protein EGM87_12665 [Sphingobium sp. RSMS]|uniref:hypothetical protein n=1 Tax=Sphingobium sp. RSMS TaxID=520734 RepID=UPI0010F6AD9E|nr:hypothetical protein [Sphingobium sp. RSMS]UXC89904.1 hypothetical protein EGM87_12665 [Sphingobium sp. RSMS]